MLSVLARCAVGQNVCESAFRVSRRPGLYPVTAPRSVFKVVFSVSLRRAFLGTFDWVPHPKGPKSVRKKRRTLYSSGSRDEVSTALHSDGTLTR